MLCMLRWKKCVQPSQFCSPPKAPPKIIPISANDQQGDYWSLDMQSHPSVVFACLENVRRKSLYNFQKDENYIYDLITILIDYLPEDIIFPNTESFLSTVEQFHRLALNCDWHSCIASTAPCLTAFISSTFFRHICLWRRTRPLRSSHSSSRRMWSTTDIVAIDLQSEG